MRKYVIPVICFAIFILVACAPAEVEVVTTKEVVTATPQPTSEESPTERAVEPTDTPQPGPELTLTATPIIHTVESGQTVSRIAAQYGVSVDAIVQANESAEGWTDRNSIEVGQKILIPTSEKALTVKSSPPTATKTESPTATPQPTKVIVKTDTPVVLEGVSWDEAISHIGEYQTVCGPVVDSYYASGASGQPTFLNLGEPYPNSRRFTIVIWGRNRGKFSAAPERLYHGKRVCVDGLIEKYDGVGQIQLDGPAQIEIK